jgi:hypothetical protein
VRTLQHSNRSGAIGLRLAWVGWRAVHVGAGRRRAPRAPAAARTKVTSPFKGISCVTRLPVNWTLHKPVSHCFHNQPTHQAVGQYAVIKAQLDAASKGQRRQSPPALPVAAAGPRNAAGPASPPFNGNGQLAGGGAGRNGVGAGMQMGRLPQGGPAAPPAGPYSA